MQRYDLKARAVYCGCRVDIDGNGPYVLHADHLREIAAKDAEIASLRKACSQANDEVCQVLGKALAYPWYKDNQKNFPGATEANGVCVGNQTAESIADEAASEIARLRQLERRCEMKTGLTVEDVRQSLRDAIFNCGFMAIGLKIENRNEEQKNATMTADNFARFGVNAGLIEPQEMDDWQRAIWGHEDAMPIGEVMMKYDETPNAAMLAEKLGAVAEPPKPTVDREVIMQVLFDQGVAESFRYTLGNALMTALGASPDAEKA